MRACSLIFGAVTLALLGSCASSTQSSVTTANLATTPESTVTQRLVNSLNAAIIETSGRRQATQAGLRGPRGMRTLRGLRGPETLEQRYATRRVADFQGLRAQGARPAPSLNATFDPSTHAGRVNFSPVDIRYNHAERRAFISPTQAPTSAYGSAPSQSPISYDPLTGQWHFN